LTYTNSFRGDVNAIHRPVHGGMVWKAAEWLKTDVNKIIDFSVNINPLGPPKKLVQYLTKNIKTITYYPDPEYKRLKAALAEYYNVDNDSIIVGNGATSLIHLFAQTFISRSDKVIIPIPTFEEYQYAAGKSGARIIYSKARPNMHMNTKEIISKLNNTKAVFVCNPNTPTSILEKRDEILNLIKKAHQTNTLILLDESFADLVVTKTPYTLINVTNKIDNLFVVKSLTKIYNTPGLRVGFGIGQRRIITELEKNKIYWSVSTLAAEAIAQILPKSKTYVERSRRYIKKEREHLIRKLSKINGMNVVGSDANFLLIDIKDTTYTSQQLTNQLIRQNILIRDCSTFTGGSNTYIRIGIKTRKENKILISALKQIMKS